LGSGGKRRLHRITDSLEVDATLICYRGIKERKVASDSRGHALAVLLPQRGTACDIRKEKGDGATG
jgi:hypothetical protein